MLQDIIDRSKRIVCFTGAGVSTASGIPDFRGAEGLFPEEWGGADAGDDPQRLLLLPAPGALL